MSGRSVPDCSLAINYEEIFQVLPILKDHLGDSYAMLEMLQPWNLEVIPLFSLRRVLKLVRQLVKQSLDYLESPALGIASDQSLL